MCFFISVVFLFGVLRCSEAALEWSEPACDARLTLTVTGDMYTRQSCEQEAALDLNELLGSERVLSAGTLSLRERDTNEKVPLDLAQDNGIRYASGNPVLRLRWRSADLKPFATRTWDLYFRTVKPGDPSAWKPLDRTFSPQNNKVIFSTSFEDADPQNLNGPLWFAPGGRDAPGEKTERMWTETEAHTGKRCLKIARTFDGVPPDNTNRPFWWTWPPSIEVREGVTYQLSVWLKAKQLDESHHGEAMVTMLFLDEKRTRIDPARNMLRLEVGDQPHDWTYVRGAITAPKGARHAEIGFQLYMAGEVYCDDLAVSVLTGSKLPELPVHVGQMEDRSTVAGRLPTAEASEKKILQCSLAKEPPKIDGVLDDLCWAEAGQIQDLEIFSPPPAGKPVLKTTVLACADHESLYFGFECEEPEANQLIANATQRDGPVWSDDSVEIFLNSNLDGQTYYQVIVNPHSVFFDQDTGAPGLLNAAWNGPIQAAAKVYKDRWTAEVKIELAGLRLAEAAGRKWKANFCRSSLRGGRALYSWVKVKQNFGEPKLFGDFLLPFDPTSNAVTGRPLVGDQLFWGRGALPFSITNRRARPVDVRVSVMSETEGSDKPIGEAKLSLQPETAAEAHIPCIFAEIGNAKLRYEVREEPGGKLLYVTSLLHSIPQPLRVSLDSSTSYLTEHNLTGAWRLGLAETALAQSKLVFAVTSGEQSLIAHTLSPERTDGTFVLNVSQLPPGDYRLHVDLASGDKVVRSEELSFERINGPFNR